MADIKISELTLKTSIASDDIITILDSADSNINKKATAESMMTYTAEALTANAPLTKSGKVFGISQATDSTDGYLTSDDWNTFNEKADAQFVQSSPSTTLTVEAGTCYKFASAITTLTISNRVVSTEEIAIQFTTDSTFSFSATS